MIFIYLWLQNWSIMGQLIHGRSKISYFYKLTSNIVSREICVGYDPSIELEQS